MAAEEDNFDIDIYGDDAHPDYAQDTGLGDDAKQDHENADSGSNPQAYSNGQAHAEENGKTEQTPADRPASPSNERNQISSTGGSAQNQVQPPKQAPIQQGTKRKEGADDRPNDPGATTALLIQDLHWWTTEDDVRGWANQAGCEDELRAVTFNEHKVNGKSKGQVYVEMTSTQAATALKHKIDSYGEGQPHMKKPTVTYNPPHINPYKTVPKDVPKRDNRGDNRSMSGNFGNQSMHNKFNQGGFQGRGGFNNQSRGGGGGGGGGGGMNQMGFQNRNFSNPQMGGMSQSGFGTPMNNFGNNPMGGMQQFGNFNRGGGMMGGGMRGGMPNRGGRGGMNPGMMGGMGGMGGMGNMGMGMPMGGMGGNMNMGMGGMGTGGFGGAQGHFNPAFFNQSQQGNSSGDQWNPHGAKRPRPE